MKYCEIDTMLNEINPQRRRHFTCQRQISRAQRISQIRLRIYFVKKYLAVCEIFFLEASPRLELGVRILQTLALPLGYDAVSYRVMPILCVERETGFGPATFTLAR